MTALPSPVVIVSVPKPPMMIERPLSPPSMMSSPPMPGATLAMSLAGAWLTVTSPLSPRMMSLPALASMTSPMAPPMMMSFPTPLVIRSTPPVAGSIEVTRCTTPPIRATRPPSPRITLSPWPPSSVSLPAPPMRIERLPNPAASASSEPVSTSAPPMAGAIVKTSPSRSTTPESPSTTSPPRLAVTTSRAAPAMATSAPLPPSMVSSPPRAGSRDSTRAGAPASKITRA